MPQNVQSAVCISLNVSGEKQAQNMLYDLVTVWPLNYIPVQVIKKYVVSSLKPKASSHKCKPVERTDFLAKQDKMPMNNNSTHNEK